MLVDQSEPHRGQHRLRAIADIELAEDRLQMRVLTVASDRSARHQLVRLALDQQAEHRTLTRRQRLGLGRRGRLQQPRAHRLDQRVDAQRLRHAAGAPRSISSAAGMSST